MTLPGFEEAPRPHVNKFVEPHLTSADRARKMTKAGDSATSYMAAQTVLKSMTKRMAETLAVFDSVAPRGLISEELDELAQARGMKPGAAPKRVHDLAGAGAIVWTGEYRATSSGCKAKVWVKT